MLDRNHNLEVKNKYEMLLKSLIPRFAQKGKNVWNFLRLCLNQILHVIIAYKQSTEALLKRRDEPIPTVDLSSDETEETSAGAAGGSANRYTQYRSSAFEFKKPSPFVDISDDDDSDPFISAAPASSTIIQSKKSEGVSRTSSFRKNESAVSIVPDVKPVNSLAERQQSRNCLKEDVITSIVQRFEESKRKNDSQINDVSQT